MKLNWIYRLSALVCVLLISGLDLNAAPNAQFKLDGITGDSTLPEYAADHVEVYGYNHEVIAPIDLATGQASGKRQHRPFKILKRLSRNSSQFANAWTRNQAIRSAEFKVFGNDPDTGERLQIYVYKFTNLRIISIRDWTANTFDPNTAAQPSYQEISFVYQTIEWQALPDGPVAQDSWAGAQQ
jgi:type VI secretion system secreted protein Hcp